MIGLIVLVQKVMISEARYAENQLGYSIYLVRS